MKYSDRDELVKGLRELADFIEDRGLELPMEFYWPFRLTQRFYGDEAKPKMTRAARAIGSAEKVHGNYDFELRKKFGNLVELVFETQRENVCVKKQVGTKQVPKRIVVEVPDEFEDEPIFEFDCSEPLLKG